MLQKGSLILLSIYLSIYLSKEIQHAFIKYINNNRKSLSAPEDANQGLKDLYEKSECLVHYSYVITDHKLMLLDIQGSKSTLYDPQIATEGLIGTEANEVYFCCGNCSTLVFKAFLSDHKCNKYCHMNHNSNECSCTV